MAEKRQKKPTYISPRGVFRYVHLNKPDRGWKGDGDPHYSVTLSLDKDDPKTAAFIAKITKLIPAMQEEAEELFANATPKTKAKWKQKNITEPKFQPFYTHEVDDEGDPTGNILFRFKTRAEFEDRKTGKTIRKVVPLVDGLGNVIPTKKRPQVYGGTEGRVAFSVGMAFVPEEAKAFVPLYLSQVQILKLVSGGGDSVQSMFDADESSDFSADDLDEQEDDDMEDDDLKDEPEEGDGSDSGDEDDDDDDEIPF